MSGIRGTYVGAGVRVTSLRVSAAGAGLSIL